jgi:hypothetical protein
MIKSHHIHVQGKSRQHAEQLLGEAFNAWVEENPLMEVVKMFEPNRWDRTFGDWNYNEYHTNFTFFYRVPAGLREL